MFDHLQHLFQLVCLLTFLVKHSVLDVIRINILANVTMLVIFLRACDISSIDFFNFTIVPFGLSLTYTFLI